MEICTKTYYAWLKSTDDAKSYTIKSIDAQLLHHSSTYIKSFTNVSQTIFKLFTNVSHLYKCIIEISYRNIFYDGNF